MAGIVSFTITLATGEEALLPELAARVKDFSPVFTNIIKEWSDHNREKFELGEGMESTGVYQDQANDLYWDPLTPAYARAKARKGFSDHLMVRTGELERALTSEGGFGQYVDASRAVFGTPIDPEDAIKVSGNWESRQAIFLDAADRAMIDREVARYLNLGDGYRDILFARGVARAEARAEEARMDMEFAEVLAGE